MGMFAFRLTLLLCSLTIYESLDAASVLENSSDLWRNWLLNENEEVPSQQGAPLSRRITPKSVFIAPVFNKCPPGTRLDAMNNCVKIVGVRIDKWEILVNKLNAAFAQTSLKPEMTQNETTTTSRVPLSTTTTTTTTTTTMTTTTTTTSTTEADLRSSTLYMKEVEQTNNATDVHNSETDISGPLQLSIPLKAKSNSSEDTADDDSSSLLVRGNLTGLLNESEMTTTTGITEDLNELVTERYDSEDTTTLPQSEVTFSTMYPDANTAGSVGNIQSDVEFSTEMTTEWTTTSDFSTEMSSLPKRYYVHRRPGEELQTNKPERAYLTSSRPELLNVPKLTVTPVANLIYSYTSGDILKVPVRFPEFGQKNQSSTDRAELNRVYENTSVRSGLFHNGAFSTTNYSDISDSAISSSSSISNSNNLILSGSSNSNSGKNDPYQKLPSNGRTRPKCDPTTGYGDCTPSSKFDSFPGTDKTSYLMNVNRGSAPSVTTIIRFPAPGVYTKGMSAVRFPTSGGGASGIITEQQHKPHGNADESSVAFPDLEVGAASRYWESNRYPTSFWHPWEAAKPHFVRIWPSNVAAGSATTYNMAGDIHYNYRSQADDYT